MTIAAVKATICALSASCCLNGQAMMQTPDSSQFLADQIVKSPVPVLVDFWAPWCMPCHALHPIIQGLKKEYAGQITVMKINVDVHRRIAAYFGITAIPAVFFIRDKTVVKALPGLLTKELYVAAINDVLASTGPSSPGGRKDGPTSDTSEAAESRREK